MIRDECSLGMEVIFGRPNGERTRGKIVKMNPKKAHVETLEDRGSHSRAGTVWRVPYSGMQLVKQTPLDEAYIKGEIEKACTAPYCLNYADPGFIFCTFHLHGSPQKLPDQVAAVKFQRDREMQSENL